MRRHPLIVTLALVTAAAGACSSNPTTPVSDPHTEAILKQSVAPQPPVDEAQTQTTASDTTGGGERGGSGGFGSGH